MGTRTTPWDEIDVAIVGGGVAGAAAACGFGEAGLSVVLFERRDLSRDPNRGDALHPMTIAHLERSGAADAVRRRGAVQLRELILADGDKARIRLHWPSLMLNHAEIEAALLETAERHGVDVRREKVQSMQRLSGRWLIESEQGSTRARLVVGADGASSLVRKMAGIKTDRTEYGESAVVLHGDHPRWLNPDCGWATLHADGPVLVVPTTPAGRCRVAVLVQASQTREWMLADEAQLGARLVGRNQRFNELSVTKHGGSHLYRLARQHAERYVDQRLALIGDAAHVTHPTGAQGMNLAIQDASTLVEQTTPALRAGARDSDLAPALAEYENRRRPINARAIALAHRIARLERSDPITHRAARATLAIGSHVPGVANQLGARLGGT